jgi:hypothetical protein
MIAWIVSQILSWVLAFYHGFILKCLWAWFIIPWIETAPQLPFVIALGVCLIVRFLTYHFSLSDIETLKDLDQDEAWKNVFLITVISFLIATGSLFSGWIIHFFV